MEVSAINIRQALRQNLQNRKMYTALFNFIEHGGKPVALLRTKVQVSPTSSDWKWNDPSYVRLPCSKANRVPGSNHRDPVKLKWEVIESVLMELNLLCKNNDAAHIATKFGEFIRMYNDDDDCNFQIFQDEELSQLLVGVLPTIIENALALGERLARPIPILKKGCNHTLYLSRDLACSLLANAFLCTFPEQPDRDLSYINFLGLFHDASESATSGIVKKEKLKCILEYFRRMKSRTDEDAGSIISFERRCVLRHVSWSCRSDQLCPVNVISDGKIERMAGMLQVDFANRCVGGGILNEGAFQEEIRFAISPELICARLFSEPLGHQEALVITGTKQFSSYSGYGSTLKFQKLRNFQSTEKDDLGRERIQVVAMDAYHFKFEDVSQYGIDKIERELHKCNVGFISGRHKTPIATGNWGCGAFNGDPELKFLIQWMAASVHKRPHLAFFAKDSNQAEGIKKMSEFLIEKNVTVGKLYDVLSKCHDKCIQYRTPLGPEMCMSVFNFVWYSFSQKQTSDYHRTWWPFGS